MTTAGYKVSLFTSGTATTITDEPAALLSGKTYRVTDATKRVLDPETTVVVKVSGSTVAASNIAGIDYLAGTVTFISSYTPAGAVTVSGKYVPRLRFAEAYAFDYTYSRTKLTSTTFSPGATSLSENSFAGLEMLSGSVQSLDPNREDLDTGANDRIIQDVIRADSVILFEHENFGLRAWVRLYGTEAGASVDARLEAGFNFESVVRKGANAGNDSSITFV